MRALVFYGSRWGGTATIAKEIGRILTEDGYSVDVFSDKTKRLNVDLYDLIVVGSGIRADKWTKGTVKFLEKNADKLRVKKTALFVSCQMADRQEKEARDLAKKKYLEEVANMYKLTPVSYGFFGGHMDFSKSHGLLVDIIVRVNRKNLKRNGLDTAKVYDTRNWKEIAAWAHEIGASLSNRS